MLREAELFVMAEEMLVEVLGRIRPGDHHRMLPAMHPGADAPTLLPQAVDRHVRADAQLPAVLLARPGSAAPTGPDAVRAAARSACEAARSASEVTDPDARDHLLQATLERCLLAHYTAAHLGSTACPLPEELARPLWELTAPDAGSWRRRGYFRAPMPLPPQVSWRDRFLLTAGHEPHPCGH